MTDTVPAPYNTVGLNAPNPDSRRRIQKSFQRIRRKIGMWPWEWLPPHFNLKPEDWNINCSDKLAATVDSVCEDRSLITHFELRDFLVRKYESCKEEKPELPSRLTTDCRLAKEWIREAQRERELARINHASESTNQVAGSMHNEEYDDSQAEFPTDILDIPKYFVIPEYGDGTHARRSFSPTGPEINSRPSPVNEMQAPNHQRSIPRKRTRQSASLESDYGTAQEEGFDSQDTNADVEMSQIETACRRSTNRNIQALDERIENTEKRMKLCSDELDEREDAVKHPNAEDKERARQEASEALGRAQEQFMEAESFMELMAARVNKRGNECPKPYLDAYDESFREFEGAEMRWDHAKTHLQALGDEMEDDRERYTETLERIVILRKSIEDCKQNIAKDEKEKIALHAKLAILDILGCHKFDLVPTETLEMFHSSASEVLRYVNGTISDM
ncbi:hypothetical protein FSPOR_6236 [Fusarium sporotrichioides]|uniref:Uncharacterized protein n=1 Tax=Fusarium sporotrichioides TaxID=5514 RepID=A0A395S488_FUSSP|nr:hypothetical protein FSPOR_6236 [Fusarium sporotrichioides]